MQESSTRHRHSLAPVAALVAMLFATACDQPVPTDPGNPEGLAPHRVASGPLKSAHHYSPDVAVDWFNLAYQLTQAERLSPPVASRAFGYEGVALYEALVPGMPEYQSLVGQLNGLHKLPRPRTRRMHWPTVANAALATIMREMYDDESSRTAIHTLQRSYVNQFRHQVPRHVFNASVKWGTVIARAIWLWSTKDGYDELHNCEYTPPVGVGLWVPTPPGFAPALEPCWGQMRTFTLPGANVCDPGPPPAYSETPGTPFFDELVEVYDAVNNLTDEQLIIAQFWSDDPGTTGTPPGHSMSIAGQILVQEDFDLAAAAEAYAKVGMGVADAFISCWWSKYEYNLVRPITVVHAIMDPEWTIPLNTPPFPEYTSGHSVQSGSAAQVMTDLWGDLPFTDHTHDHRGFAPRSFDSFTEFADEAAISRLYGGIHYRAAIDLGVLQGNCVGQFIDALQFLK